MENLMINKTENRRSNGVTTRQIVMSICFIAIACASFAQDIIVTKDSKRIEAKVVEVNVDNIRYRQSDNIEGPLYTILKNDVVSITFQNGLTQTFATPTPVQTTESNTQATEMRTQSNLASTQTTQAYNPYNRRLTNAEKLREMQINYPALFSKYNAGRKMRTTGWVLTGTGLAAIFIGAAVGVDGDDKGDEDQSAGGFAVFTAGVGLVAGGVTVLAIGAGTRRRALRAFDSQYYSKQPTSQFQLNVHPNSVGLAYVF